MLVDDIFDTGNTINALVNILLRDYGVPRENIKVVVHDYKCVTYKELQPIQPDYWCRKFTVTSPEEDLWIHYMSHELVGLSQKELEENYYRQDPELQRILGSVLENK